MHTRKNLINIDNNLGRVQPAEINYLCIADQNSLSLHGKYSYH